MRVVHPSGQGDIALADVVDENEPNDHNRDMGSKQLDDGMGDTLVSVTAATLLTSRCLAFSSAGTRSELLGQLRLCDSVTDGESNEFSQRTQPKFAHNLAAVAFRRTG